MFVTLLDHPASAPRRAVGCWQASLANAGQALFASTPCEYDDDDDGDVDDAYSPCSSYRADALIYSMGACCAFAGVVFVVVIFRTPASDVADIAMVGAAAFLSPLGFGFIAKANNALGEYVRGCTERCAWPAQPHRPPSFHRIHVLNSERPS
jgi:hypothetical protein